MENFWQEIVEKLKISSANFISKQFTYCKSNRVYSFVG